MLHLQIYYQCMQLDLSLSPITAAKVGKQLCTARLSSPPQALQQCLSGLSPQTHQGPPRTAPPSCWLLLAQPSLGFPSTSVSITQAESQHIAYFVVGAGVLFYMTLRFCL